MFKRQIVIIVGAGSGVEYSMPLGATLAADIARDVRFRFEHYSLRPTSGDPQLFDILFRKFNQDRPVLDKFTEAGNALSSAISSAVSIDDALYQLSENPEAVALGKLCIIRAILKAEGNSSLALSRQTGQLDHSAGRNGWIEQVFSMAIAGVKQSEIHHAFDNITFVNFNYDRCIEHYLFWSLQRIGIDHVAARLIVGGLNMIRPYGAVGAVLESCPNYLPFGGGSVDPFAVVNRIRTYTESDVLHDSAHLQSVLLKAHLTLFLGFGFHPQNLSLLQVGEPSEGRLMATVKKIHQANRSDLTDALSRTMRVSRNAIELFDMTAPELLAELRLKIMMQAGAN
jgi:hypothetical protein